MNTHDFDYVVTVNHAGQQQIHKINIDQNQSIVIGRSWRSDIVVNDAYLDPAHVKLSVDTAGQLQVKDLSTKNGSRLGKRLVQGTALYKSGNQLLIGDSTVSVHNTTEPVVPAVKRDTVQKLSGKYHSIFWYLFATLAAFAAMAITHGLLNDNELTNERVASSIGRAAFTGFVICCIGGFMSKLSRQKSLLGLHYMFACWAFLLVALATLAWDIIAFNLEPGLLTTVLGEAQYFALGILILFGALSLTSRLTKYKRLAIALVMLGLPTAYQLITPQLETEYNAWNDYVSMDSVNQPPLFHFKGESSVEQHLLDTEKLFTRLSDEVDWSERDSTNTTPSKHNNAVHVSVHQ